LEAKPAGSALTTRIERKLEGLPQARKKIVAESRRRHITSGQFQEKKSRGKIEKAKEEGRDHGGKKEKRGRRNRGTQKRMICAGSTRRIDFRE